jgi:hypothetical protein
VFDIVALDEDKLPTFRHGVTSASSREELRHLGAAISLFKLPTRFLDKNLAAPAKSGTASRSTRWISSHSRRRFSRRWYASKIAISAERVRRSAK